MSLQSSCSTFHISSHCFYFAQDSWCCLGLFFFFFLHQHVTHYIWIVSLPQNCRPIFKLPVIAKVCSGALTAALEESLFVSLCCLLVAFHTDISLMQADVGGSSCLLLLDCRQWLDISGSVLDRCQTFSATTDSYATSTEPLFSSFPRFCPGPEAVFFVLASSRGDNNQF